MTSNTERAMTEQSNLISMAYLTDREQFIDAALRAPDLTARERDMAETVRAIIRDAVERRERNGRIMRNVESLSQGMVGLQRQLAEQADEVAGLLEPVFREQGVVDGLKSAGRPADTQGEGSRRCAME